jgi:hypothetical protein
MNIPSLQERYVIEFTFNYSCFGRPLNAHLRASLFRRTSGKILQGCQINPSILDRQNQTDGSHSSKSFSCVRRFEEFDSAFIVSDKHKKWRDFNFLN